MVISARIPIKKIEKCPHCGSRFLSYDVPDREPYCFICGWCRAIQISKDQARNHFSSEREF